MAGGYYVFEADDLDEALALARDIPAAKYGAVEVWPMVEWLTRPNRSTATPGSRCCWSRPTVVTPGTPEWDAGIAKHVEFGAAAGDQLNGGAALHPPTTATTVRVRDGKVALTDGPFAEGAEVANGFYLINTGDRDEAVKIASMIPASTVELRQLAGNPDCEAAE